MYLLSLILLLVRSRGVHMNLVFSAFLVLLAADSYILEAPKKAAHRRL